MKAELFFETNPESAVPLYLLSKSECEQELLPLSLQEKNWFKSRDFKGKLGEACLIHNANGEVSKAYLGSGDGNQELALANAPRLLPSGCYQVQAILSQTAALNWALAQYQFDAYKTIDAKLCCLVVKESDLKAIVDLAESLFLVRDLINTPANDMGPKEMAEVLEQLARVHGGHFEQWVGDELIKANFPAIYAVGCASASPPRLLSLSYGDESHPRVTLVGKGVTFDSGGLNIKPASGMRLMKKDMGGAAHVIGLAQWIMQKRLPIRLKVLIPAVENAVAGNALRPGDVLRMRNKLSVEVDNTDAEGRLILADALVKASEEKPDLIIDFSTLTGAARIALGTDIAVMFTNNDKLAEDLMAASQKVKDPIWRLPLYSGYEDLFSSSVADLSNCSPSPFAGAIIAALFLQRFLIKPINWVHFDVMAWNLSSRPGRPEGGDALGLRAVAEYLLRVYA